VIGRVRHDDASDDTCSVLVRQLQEIFGVDWLPVAGERFVERW
jgi:hypothetical protein